MKGITYQRLARALRRSALFAGGVLAASLVASPAALAQEAESQSEATPADVVQEAPAVIAQEAEPTTPPSPEVAAAIAQLEGDQYAARQAAQRQLISLGVPALEPTARAAAEGSLESSTRAVNILWTWADSSDQALALPALEKLAALVNRPLEAAEAQRRLADFREVAAIAAIQELGGHVAMDRYFGMMGGFGSPLQIIINKDWKGGTEGLRHIAHLRNATTLSMYGAPIGDEGLAELEKLGNVKKMEFFGQKFTPELVDKVREKLPTTILDVRKTGARLGIRGLDSTEIVPNSPAAKAGLMVGDKIIEFDGKPITEFEELTAEISNRMPGETVTIKFLRADEPREAKVTFDRWGDDVAAGRPGVDAPAGAQGLFGPVPRLAPTPTRVPFGELEPIPESPSDPLPK